MMKNETFFGRQNVLDLLKRRVADLKEGYRQNVALLGHPFVGKSTIIQQFILNYDDDDVIFVNLDLENKDMSYFFRKFAGSLLYNYCKSKSLRRHEDLELLLEEAKSDLPQTVQVIRKIQNNVRSGKLAAAYLGLLNLPEVFTNETNKYCVLVFDEFQVIEDFMIPHAFQDLGKKIMTQKRCFYIFSSSYPLLAKKILSEQLSLLFGNFEIIEIDAFDLQVSQKFIEKSIGDVRIGVQLSNFLTDFTGGHPLYLHLLSQEMLNLSAIYKQNEIYMPILAQAIENTIFRKWGVISRHFDLIIQELCSGKGNKANASLLIALANGKQKVEELTAILGLSRNQVMQRMKKLVEQGIIVRNGSFHYFKDKLFRYWIKYVHQKRTRDVELSPDKQRTLFKEELALAIEEFKVSSRQDFPTRIVELLHCFDNEKLELNGRNYKMPSFREIIPFKLRNDTGNYFDVIKAKTQDSTWFVILKKDSFGESDVNAIIDEAKRTGIKPERCLIISLADLDENTRVRALQERFWIWNEGELKTLLTLFDKPFIVS